MENISKILAEWGSWIANENNLTDFLLTDKKGNIPSRVKLGQKCTLHQSVIISDLMHKLYKYNEEYYQLLIHYYVYGETFLQLARNKKCSDTYIGKQLKKAEGVIEGMLAISNINLSK